MQFIGQSQPKQFSKNIEQSFHQGELEQAMKAVFVGLISQQHTALTDIFDYGTPFMGTKQVIERFTKLNGLAILRRENDNLADRIMAIILANWQALASERGLAFLQFVLDMLYPKQNEVIQLYHSKTKSHLYPLYLSEQPTNDSFLTSRIRIKIADNVDMKELVELVPVFRRLVPAHIVPDVTIQLDLPDLPNLGMAMASHHIMVADFS